MKRAKIQVLALAALLAMAPMAWATDTDSDGLSDAFESAFGTDPNSADSDSDNLSDYEELYVTGTDPNLADTDGDLTNDDVDTNPLEDTGPSDGSTTVTYGTVPTTVQSAWSGETPFDGIGVNVTNGAFNFSAAAAQTKGVVMPFQLGLVYNSQWEWDGTTGRNWFSVLDQKLSGTGFGSNLTLVMEDGVERTWTWNGTNTNWESPNEIEGELITYSSGADEYKRELPSGAEFVYVAMNAGGYKLGSFTDPYGNSMSFTYNLSDEVTTATDTRGEDFTFTYYSTGRLKQIDAPTGDSRTWKFFYNKAAQLIRIEGPSTATFTGGIHQEFRYTSGSTSSGLNHNLTVAIDGRGNPWLINEYDANDRVEKQWIGQSTDAVEFDYVTSPSTYTRVTDRMGNERDWKWHSTKLTKTELIEYSNRNVRSGDPTSWTTEWTHDADGYLTEVEYPEGNGCEYTLNAVKKVTEKRRKTDVDAANHASDLVESWTYATGDWYVTKYTDAEGNETDYTLNTEGQPTTITFETVTTQTPNQTITHTYTYNSNGTVASFTDGEGKKTTYSYYTTGDRKGRLEKKVVDDVVSGLQLETSYDYEDWGSVKSVTDPNGNTTTYTVEAYGNVTKIAAPTALGYETEFTHDGNLNVVEKKVKRIDEDGTALTGPTHWTTDYTYTWMDKPSQVVEEIASGTTRTIDFDYDENDMLVLTDRNDKVVGLTYDERNLLWRRIKGDVLPAGLRTTEYFTYDGNRNLTKYEDPRSNDTTHEYDGFDRRTKTINAATDYTEMVYDDNGNLTERKFYEELGATDDLLAHTKHHYDELNRRYKSERWLEVTGGTDEWHATTRIFDKRHLVTKVTDALSRDTDITYDAAGRRTEVEDALGNITTYTLDDNGNVTKIEQEEVIPGSVSTETFTTEFTYDAINRRLTQKVIDRNNASNHKTTTWKYDYANVAMSVTDPMGWETTAEHDGLGRVTKRTAPIDGTATMVTQWTFDEWDNVTKLTDDNNNDTIYTFDDLNRLTQKDYEDTTSVEIDYDDNGNVTEVTDQNGTVITMGYDVLNRMTARDAVLGTGVIGDTDEDFTYDALGRMTQAKDDDTIVNFTFDTLSRMLTEEQGDNPLGSSGKTVTYTWDKVGNLTQIDYPSGFEAHRTYDDINRLTGIDDDSSTMVAEIDFYGAAGRRKQVDFGNGTLSAYSWDGYRRVTAIDHEDSLATEFAGFDYGWDKNDNPTYEERSHASGSGDVYTYDRSNRLTKVLEWVADPSNEVANPGTETYADKVEYTMDEVHNLSSLKVTPYGGSATTTNFTSNAMNEYTAVGGTTHVYDSNGNLTDDGVNLYSYDFHNHLVKVVDKGTSTTIAEYEYDAVGRGRRTAKVVGSNTTRFIYHGQHVLEELDGSDTLLRLFAYADGWDNVVMMEAPDVADVDNDANTTELKRFYYHTQLIGSITHITDDDEVVVESYEYDAYGNTTIYDINSSSVSGSQIENPYMYTARRMDEESGLYHYRARAYSPTLRRFIQRDPLEYVDGPNALAYGGGMPTRVKDPTGEFLQALAIVVVVVVVVAVAVAVVVSNPVPPAPKLGTLGPGGGTGTGPNRRKPAAPSGVGPDTGMPDDAGRGPSTPNDEAPSRDEAESGGPQEVGTGVGASDESATLMPDESIKKAAKNLHRRYRDRKSGSKPRRRLTIFEWYRVVSLRRAIDRGEDPDDNDYSSRVRDAEDQLRYVADPTKRNGDANPHYDADVQRDADGPNDP